MTSRSKRDRQKANRALSRQPRVSEDDLKFALIMAANGYMDGDDYQAAEVYERDDGARIPVLELPLRMADEPVLDAALRGVILASHLRPVYGLDCPLVGDGDRVVVAGDDPDDLVFLKDTEGKPDAVPQLPGNRVEWLTKNAAGTSFGEWVLMYLFAAVAGPDDSLTGPQMDEFLGAPPGWFDSVSNGIPA